MYLKKICSFDGKPGFLVLHKSVHVWMFMLIAGTVRALCHGAIQAKHRDFEPQRHDDGLHWGHWIHNDVTGMFHLPELDWGEFL